MAKKYYLVKINSEVLVTNAKNREEALTRAKEAITQSEYTIEEKNPKNYK